MDKSLRVAKFNIIDMRKRIIYFYLIISIVLMIITCFLLYKYGLRIYKEGILNYSSSKLWNKIFKSLKNKN